MENSTPPAVIMGVAGSGKTVIGSALAEALGVAFIEGDDLHPPENVAKMASGQPLTDEDRIGWLDAVGRAIAENRRPAGGAVTACSALKRSYRDQLRRLNPSLVFIYLAINPDTARIRVTNRKGHFMPPTLVASQFAALEQPGDDEAAFTLNGLSPIDELVEAAAELLRKQSGAS
ncbi:gluconokinase, GntK/IdnK-type [Chelativorans oligotrophicus]|uniref:Gluconokinase n=2 Tax=Chelativorans TaxID=449972 RepID=Q11LK5_CHESB